MRKSIGLGHKFWHGPFRSFAARQRCLSTHQIADVNNASAFDLEQDLAETPFSIVFKPRTRANSEGNFDCVTLEDPDASQTMMCSPLVEAPSQDAGTGMCWGSHQIQGYPPMSPLRSRLLKDSFENDSDDEWQTGAETEKCAGEVRQQEVESIGTFAIFAGSPLSPFPLSLCPFEWHTFYWDFHSMS